MQQLKNTLRPSQVKGAIAIDRTLQAQGFSRLADSTTVQNENPIDRGPEIFREELFQLHLNFERIGRFDPTKAIGHPVYVRVDCDSR